MHGLTRTFFPAGGWKQYFSLSRTIWSEPSLRMPAVPLTRTGLFQSAATDFSYFLGLELIFSPSTSVCGAALRCLWWVKDFPGPAGPGHLTQAPCLSLTPLWGWAALIFPLEMKQQSHLVSVAKQECEPKPGKSSGDAWRGFVIGPQHRISHKPRPCHLSSATS